MTDLQKAAAAAAVDFACAAATLRAEAPTLRLEPPCPVFPTLPPLPPLPPAPERAVLEAKTVQTLVRAPSSRQTVRVSRTAGFWF